MNSFNQNKVKQSTKKRKIGEELGENEESDEREEDDNEESDI